MRRKTILEKRLARLKTKKEALAKKALESQDVNEVRSINDQIADINDEIADTQEELDAMIATWNTPEDFASFGEYVIGRGFEMSFSPDQGVIGGVFVSDGNGGIVQIGDENGYNPVEEQTR